MFLILDHSTILVGDHSIIRIILFKCVVGGSNILSHGVVVLQHWPKWQCGMRPYFLCVTEWSLCGYVFLMDWCDVHPFFGLKGLGVEEAQNWFINLVNRGTSQTYQEGL